MTQGEGALGCSILDGVTSDISLQINKASLWWWGIRRQRHVMQVARLGAITLHDGT